VEPGETNGNGGDPNGVERITRVSTYTQILYHVVFATKDREPVLEARRRDDLWRYIWGILKNQNCHLYRINGIEDHLHILTGLHPTIALSGLVKDIKVATNGWIREQSMFPRFSGWQEGYGAFTASWKEKDRLIEYIKGQEEHHRRETSKDELRRLIDESGIEIDERYFA
jgi:REP element-mobilizing transposase RayT